MQVEIFEIRTYWTEQNLGQKFNWRFQFPHIMVNLHIIVFDQTFYQNERKKLISELCVTEIEKEIKKSKTLTS